jgi:ParB family chromosome partitioning protein
MDPQALEDLAESVRQHGVLMPILFRQDAALEADLIVAGERRFEAAKMAGLTAIPGIFIEGNHAEIALVENLLIENQTGNPGLKK